VGVVAEVKDYSLANGLARGFQGLIYVPYGVQAVRGDGSNGPIPEMTLVVKTSNSRLYLFSQIARLLTDINPNVPAPEIRTIKSVISNSVSSSRSTTGFLVMFANSAGDIFGFD